MDLSALVSAHIVEGIGWQMCKVLPGASPQDIEGGSSDRFPLGATWPNGGQMVISLHQNESVNGYI